VLAGQAAHAVVLPQPKVPEGQGWQAVLTPSMKKVPEPQQKGVPVGVQRTVPEGQDMVQLTRCIGVVVSPRKL
jgi:hypothetical protein